jgi:hypothetical protein
LSIKLTIPQSDILTGIVNEFTEDWWAIDLMAVDVDIVEVREDLRDLIRKAIEAVGAPLVCGK